MAHSVTGASLDEIYSRLNDAPQYHPLDAQTFADWTVEAGDVVRFQRGNVNYDSPVHSTKVVWRGTPQVTVSSTGAKEREPVSKVSRKKYGRGGNAVRSEERIYHEFTSEDGLLHSAISISAAELTTAFQNADAGLASQITVTAEELTTAFQNADAGLASQITVTAGELTAAFQNADEQLSGQITATAEQLTTEYQAADGELSSRITENANSISAEVTNRENSDVELAGRLEILADKASLVVTATDTRAIKTYLRRSDFPATGSSSYLYYDYTDKLYYEWSSGQYVVTTPGNEISRAGIIASINENGQSTTKILGSKVSVGSAGSTVSLSDAMEIQQTGAIGLKNNTVIDGNLTITAGNEIIAGDIRATGIRFPGEHQTDDRTLTLSDVTGMIVKAEVDNNTNTLKLWKKGDAAQSPSITFRKAASLNGLTGDWSGSAASGKTLTVITDPLIQGINYTVAFGSQTGNQRLALDIDRTETPSAIAGTTNIRVPLRAYTQGSSQYDPGEVVYTTTAALDISSLLEDKTGNNKIDANGTYSPSSGYIGFGAVEVLVPSQTITPILTGGWAGTTLSVSSTPAPQADFSTTLSTNYFYDNSLGLHYIQTKSTDSGAQSSYVRMQDLIALDPGTVSSGSRTITFKHKNSNTGLTYACSDYGDGFNAGVPTGTTLGTKVTGTVWNVNIARGSYAAVAKTIDLASAYSDARDGYYTKAQYDANWTTGFDAGVPTGTTLGSKVTGTVWNVSVARGSYAAVGKTIDLASAYSDARSGYYTKEQYDANWTGGFNAGEPTAVTLGSKVTGTVWNVSVARGSYSAVAKTIDLASAYNDARSGYYTKAQYDANWTTGFDAGVPTGTTLGTKVTGTVWNVNIARGSYSAVAKTIDLASAYNDARSGYYTKAQYDANYNAGYSAGYTVGDISVEYTGYSNNTKRYTITSGSGSSANCSMQVKMYAHDYSETDTWNAPVTNAYRDGYAKGKEDGGGSTHSIVITTKSDWYTSSSASESDAKSAAAQAMGVKTNNLTTITYGRFRNNCYIWFKVACGTAAKYYFTKTQ